MDISKAKDILDYWFSNHPYTPNYDNEIKYMQLPQVKKRPY